MAVAVDEEEQLKSSLLAEAKRTNTEALVRIYLTNPESVVCGQELI
jgi:hypothetical protein